MSAPHVCRSAASMAPSKIVLFFVCVTAFNGLDFAEADTPAEVDPSCANYCAARGYDSGFCGRACAPQTVTGGIPADADIDWQCVTVCRNGGAHLIDCIAPCRRR